MRAPADAPFHAQNVGARIHAVLGLPDCAMVCKGERQRRCVVCWEGGTLVCIGEENGGLWYQVSKDREATQCLHRRGVTVTSSLSKSR